MEEIKLKTTNYDVMLGNLIENLLNSRIRKNYTALKGGDGTAYLIDENFVVKVFSERKMNNYIEKNNLNLFFEEYCKELKRFSEEGYRVPKIYSWEARGNKLYILEERAVGREIYFPNLKEFYPEVSNEFSEIEYNYAVKYGRDKLFNEIFKRFSNDFIHINSFLEALPELEIEAFVEEIYEMYLNGLYSKPDVYPFNIFCDGDKFTFIDQKAEINFDEKQKIEKACEFMTYSLIKLFEVNSLLRENINKYKTMNYDSGIDYDFAETFIDKNLKVSKAGLIKFLRVAKKTLNLPKLKDSDQKQSLKKIISKVFEEKTTSQEILEIMEK